MDHANPLLKPVVVLVGWTLVMLFVMAFRRGQAFKAHRVDVGARNGGRGQDLDGRVEAKYQWPAHNYMHLVEQPTIFYAIVLVLVLIGDTHPINLMLAWGYALVRIAHSLWQSFVNVVKVRFLLFLLSTLCLIGLTLHAAIALFG